jgi:DNA-directed RNA polymerase subunit RPC12/RpoP
MLDDREAKEVLKPDRLTRSNDIVTSLRAELGKEDDAYIIQRGKLAGYDRWIHYGMGGLESKVELDEETKRYIREESLRWRPSDTGNTPLDFVCLEFWCLRAGAILRPDLAEKALRRALFIRQCAIERAKEFERAFRIDDAAAFYEIFGMIDVAGALRKSALTTRTINVDLIALMERIRSQGLVADYKCPNCSAGINIRSETETSGLQFCGHCGSRLATMDLADFLTKLLGP